MALEVFRSQGTNAVPFLIAELVRSTRNSAIGDFVEEVNELLPQGLNLPGVERRVRREAALGVLAQLDLGLADLLPGLEPHLKSTEPDVVRTMIRTLGCVRRQPGEAAIELKKYLASRDRAEIWVAIRALESLGSSATHAVTEVLQIGVKGRNPSVLKIVGACGLAAEAAVPELEQQWRESTDRGERMRLAITLCRIRPGHPEAWAFLESVARGEQRKVPLRLYPIEIARSLRGLKVQDPEFAPLLLGIVKSETNGVGSVVMEVADALNEADPRAADRFLRERILGVGATNTHLRSVLAARLLKLQPTNAFACGELLKYARTAGNTGASIIAVQALAYSSTSDEAVGAMLEAKIQDPKQHPLIREALARRLQWVRLRQQLGISPRAEPEYGRSTTMEGSEHTERGKASPGHALRRAGMNSSSFPLFSFRVFRIFRISRSVLKRAASACGPRARAQVSLN